jgi:hypothetical protein
MFKRRYWSEPKRHRKRHRKRHGKRHRERHRAAKERRFRVSSQSALSMSIAFLSCPPSVPPSSTFFKLFSMSIELGALCSEDID